MSYNQTKHQMIFAGIQDTGLEEWYCPVCGRRMLLEWPPHYRKIIVERGEELANHKIWKDHASTNAAPGVPVPQLNPNSLAPWQAWMEKVNFNARWGESQ